jgi:hypothetical protein
MSKLIVAAGLAIALVTGAGCASNPSGERTAHQAEPRPGCGGDTRTGSRIPRACTNVGSVEGADVDRGSR